MAALLKSHFSMGVVLQICCIFIRIYFYVRTPHKNTSGGLFPVKTIYSKMSSHFEMSCNRVKTFTLTSCVKKQKCPGNLVADLSKICQFQCLANLVWNVSSLHSIGRILFLNIANSTLKQNRVCFFRKVTDCRPNPKKEFLHGIFKDSPE